MLSAETAAGQYPYEAVNMMDRIVARVEQDEGWRAIIDASRPAPEHTVADAIAEAAGQVSQTIGTRATIAAYTTSGSTVLRVARTRPESPILGLTIEQATARRMAVVWGVHAVQTSETPLDDGDGQPRDADRPQPRASPSMATPSSSSPAYRFGQPGTTNALRVAEVK